MKINNSNMICLCQYHVSIVLDYSNHRNIIPSSNIAINVTLFTFLVITIAAIVLKFY